MRNMSAPAPSLNRRKLYIAMVTASQLMWAGQSYASPEGGQVVGGAGKIDQSGKETVIHQQTDRMAIDWQSFDVKADERVQFVQPNASSIALNRVVSNKGSQILGRVDANGQVLLVNPNGVVFGKDSQINVGGILASGLTINPTEFMNGNFTLSEVEGAVGKVVNSGIINAATGGSVTLLGKEVTNEGLIIASLGAVNLAVGKEAIVTFENNGLIGVKVTKEVLQNELGVDAALINSGEIKAEGGRILLTASTSQDIFSDAVNHEGMNAATSVVVNDDGSFTLGAGADVVNTGKISANSAIGNAGQIVVIGDKVTNSGTISADSQTGSGGHIELNSKDTTILNQSAIVSAQSFASGKGGDVKILGDKVGLMDSASVNASGATGGGQVLIGGDETGKNKLINNANFIYLGESTNVKTDALLNGNGGKLITFAQDTARIYGNLSARGGSESGNGGFIETSGLKGFDILNAPDTSAQNGLGGTWLIDPFSITISGSASPGTDIPVDTTTGSPDKLFASSSTKSTIRNSTITNALSGTGKVIVRTTGSLAAGNTTDTTGDIEINDDINYNSSSAVTATLRLEAQNNIKLASGRKIEATGQATLNIEFVADTDNNGAGGSVDLGTGSILTNGGNFTSTSKGFNSAAAKIDTSSTTGGGAISITSTGDISLGDLFFTDSTIGNTQSRVGKVTVVSDGSVTLHNNLNFDDAGFLGATQSFLNVTAKGDIVVNGNIYDSGAGEYDALNLSFTADSDNNATGSFTLNAAKDIYTSGGNFYLSAQSIALNGRTIDTQNANAGNDSLRSNGGNVTIKSSTDFSLGNILTDSTCTATSNCTGNFIVESRVPASQNISVSQTSGKTLNIHGASAFNIGSGDLNLINNNLFTGSLSFTKAKDVTLVNTAGTGVNLDASIITGLFNLTSSGDITDSGALDITGTTTINAASHSVVLDNANNFGGLVSFTNPVTKLTLNDSTTDTLAVGAVATNGGAGTAGAIILASAGSLVTGNLTTTKAASDAGSITLSATGSTLTAGTLSADGGTVTGTATGKNGGAINVTASSDISVGAVSAKGSNASTTGVGGVGGSISFNSTTGNIVANAITTSGGNAAGTNFAGGAAGTISLSANASTKNILLQNNLTAKGGTKTGTSIDGAGKNITLTGDVKIKNAAGITIDSSGATSGAISFTKALDSDASQTTDLTLTGGSISFGITDIGINNSLGKLVVNSPLNDIGSSSNKRTFNATSFDLSAKNIYANTLNSLGGAVNLSSTGAVSITKIDTHKDGAIGGNVVLTAGATNVTIGEVDTHGGLAGATGFAGGDITLNGQTLTLGALNSTGSDGAGNGGDAGAIKVYGKTINLNGDIKSEGGAGTTPGVSSEATVDVNTTGGAIVLGKATSTYTSKIKLTNTNNDGALSAQNIVNSWNLDGTNTLNETVTSGISFSGFNILNGNADADTFSITAAFAGTINGGNGSNIFDIGANVANIQGGSNKDTFNITTTAAITAVLDGGGTSDADVLNAASRANDWVLGGTTETLNAITSPVSGITFSKIEDLNGSTLKDTFKITGTRGGAIDAGTGSEDDIVLVDSDITVDFTQTSINGVQNAEIIKNTNSDAKKMSVTSTTGSSVMWKIWDFDLVAGSEANGVNDGEITSGSKNIKFVNFSTLAGGAGNDTFNFAGAASVNGLIDGGTGINDLNLSGATGDRKVEIAAAVGTSDITVTRVNSITANSTTSSTLFLSSASGSSNTWTIAGTNSGSVGGISFTDFSNLIGGAGSDIFDFSSLGNTGSVSGVIDGSSGSNTVKARVAVANTWTMLSNNSGSLSETANLPAKYINSFVSIQNFTGSNSGVNTMDFTAFSGDVKIELGNGVSGASFITSFIGNYSSVDGRNAEIVGADLVNDWQITDVNKGSVTNSVGTINFEGFNKLTGGTANDDFTITSLGSFEGTMSGGTNGADTLTRGSSTAIAWTLGAANAGNVGTIDFLNIDSIIGSGSDSLTGRNQINDWTLSGNKNGDVHLTGDTTDKIIFSGINKVIGLTNIDSFNLTSVDALSILIDGGTGADNKLMRSYSGAGAWIIDGVHTGTLDGKRFTNISEIIGNSSNTGNNDTLTGRDQANDWTLSGSKAGDVHLAGAANTADKITFSGINKVIGLAGVDTFTLTSANALSLTVDGGGLGNKLVRTYIGAATWQLDDAHSGKLGIMSFSNIVDITGNDNDTLVGRNQANSWLIVGAGSGTVAEDIASPTDQMIFKGMNTLTGNVLGDKFVIDATGSIDSIKGVAGTGENSLTSNIGSNNFVMVGANSGLLNVTTSFDNIQKIIGGSAADKLTGSSSASTWTFDAKNTLAVDGNSNFVEFSGIEIIQGGDDQDTFAFKAAFSGDVNGGGGADIFNISATVKKLFGENGNDTFTLFAAGNVDYISGGLDSNTLTGQTAENKWVLTSTNAGSLNKSTTAYVNSFELIQTLQGSGLDSLTGINQSNKWVITGENSGSVKQNVTNPTDTVTFFGMSKLIGGTSADYFDFSTNVTSAITGSVDGGDTGADSNKITGRAGKNSWIINSDETSGQIKVFGVGGAVYVNSFLNIQTLDFNTGDGVVADTWDLSKKSPKNLSIEGTNSETSKLIGFDQNNSWEITNENTGTIKYGSGSSSVSVKFSGFTNLTGGKLNDDFSFLADGSVSGILDGGTGINSILGISDAANTWQMSGSNSGTATAAGAPKAYADFKNIHKIVGGNKIDVLRGITSNAGITAQNWKLTDSENSFFLTDPNINIKFIGMENIEGGDGTNTLINTITNKNWVLTNANHGTINSVIFSKINSIQGSGTDSLIGRDQENNWQISSAGAGTVSQNNFTLNDTLIFSGMNKLVGGTGIDVFTLGGSGSVANLDGGSTLGDTNNSLVSKARENTWTIEANGTSNTLYGQVDPVRFVNISDLTGGSGYKDLFQIKNISVIKGILDGGAGENNTVDLTGVADGIHVKVSADTSEPADVRIANITQLNAKINDTNINTLVANNVAGNTFTLTGSNSGSLNSMTFNGFANLVGSDLQDKFVFTGTSAKLSGIIDGGTYSGTDVIQNDTLSLLLYGANGNVTVSNDDLTPTVNMINIINIEGVEANSKFVNTLTAKDKINTWSITAIDSGSLSNDGSAAPITFSNFSILVGGKNDDLFKFSQTGKLNGYIDGGLHNSGDTVDLSGLTGAVDIVLGNLDKGYRRIEKFIGNKADSTLYGDDNNNTWNLTGTNSGNINDVISFTDFASFIAGDGDDIFNLFQGQLTGSVSGGLGKDTFNVANAIVDGSLNGDAGDDIFNVTISESSAESIRFIGGDGDNTVNVSGKAGDTNTYQATHSAAIAGGGVLRYDVNKKTHSINYANAKEVNDLLTADTLTIDGTDAADVFALSNNAYLLNNFTQINYQNKNNLVVAGSASDKVAIAAPINIPNLLTLKKVSVATTGTGVIRANSLLLDGTASVGTSDNRLQTNIANLSINTSAGDIYIQEQSGLNISGFTSNNKVDVMLDGNLTSDVLLASIGQFNVVTTGNIILDKENALTGELNLKTTKNITFKNSTGTTFGNVSADILNVNSTGSIESTGVVAVGGIATLSSGLDINLQNAQNDFTSVSVTNAHNVNLVDSNSLTLSTIGATGDIKTQSQGIILNGAVNGGSLSVNAGAGTANIANTINVQTNVDLIAQSIVIAGNIDAKAIVKATSTGDFSQASNITGGSVDLNVGKYTANTGVTTTATSGSVSINSASDIATKNINAVNDIILKTANDATIGGTVSTSSGKVDLLAGRNVTLSNDVNGQGGVSVFATNGGAQLQALLNSAKGDVIVKTSGDLTMGASASTTAAEGSISYAGKNLTVTALSALNGDVTFNSSAAVIDANANLTNITAKKFTVDAISGIGALDDLETTVAGLSLATQGNNIRIINTGKVTVDRMRTNSNIYLSNYKGDVLLDNSANPVFSRTEPDALLAGGTMNSNYNLSDLFIKIDSGSLLMAPDHIKGKEMPAIVANNAKIDIAGGQFGSLASPIIVYVRGDFVYTATRYTKPNWAFGVLPANPVKGPGVQTSLIDLLSAGAEQLVVVEEINEINPAVFTNVRNYVYDDIAIMLPADQRYEETFSNAN